MLDSHAMLEELRPGKIFHDRYEIVRCIKAGGMGAVYEVIHLETRRHRAMKVMLPSIVGDDAMRNRFRLEAQITADVESDHIVETFDAGINADTGAPFLVMELLRGEDLAHHVRVRGALPAAEVVGLLQQLARALEQTHAAGIVHRDLKPENLFLAVRGDDPPRLKVLDFGIAKIVAQSSSSAGTTSVGTPLYMAPEQLEGGGISARTDLYAVAHIAFTLLTGRAYWMEEADTIGILPLIRRLASGAEELPSRRAAGRGVRLPSAFDVWFARSTARLPASRFEGAREQAAALADALGVTPQQAVIPSPVTGPSPTLTERDWAEDQETMPAPLLVKKAEPADLVYRSPLSGSAVVAPAGTAGWIEATALSATPEGLGSAAAPPPELPSSSTHHASVRNVHAPAAKPGGRVFALGAGAVVLLGVVAFAVLRRSEAPTEAPVAEAPSQRPTPGAAPPPPPAPPPSPPVTPPELVTAGTSAPPAPRVDPAVDGAPAAARASVTPPAASAVVPVAGGAPRTKTPAPRAPVVVGTPAAGDKPPPAAKRDPSKVFD